MVYKRYKSPFEEPDFCKKEPEPFEPQPKEQCSRENKDKNPGIPGFLDSLSNDDILLIGLIVILLAEKKESRDVPLILTLGFLFLIQYIDAD